MSENTWEIMKGMELGDVELQMALQCAPVITGVKVSNLLNIELSGYRQMVEILKDSDICMYTLGATCGRVNVFIYNAAKLRAFVQRDDVQRLMSELGYADMELSEILAEFRGKYQQYLKSRGRFTSKQPSQEVEGFILQNGRNALCSGYWKVYDDAESKRRTFHIFECAEERLIQFLSNGLHMRDIMGMYTASRNAA